MLKVMLRESCGEDGGRASHIANVCGPFPHLVHNVDRPFVRLPERLCGLQRARIGRDDDACERHARERLRGRRSLLEAERRQFRIFDSGIHARVVEVQIEIALPVAE